MSSDLATRPLHELAAGISGGQFSPVDVVEACLARVQVLDLKLHAFIDLYESDARLAAEAADKAIRSGHAVGPLHGLPIALKDLVEIEGRVTTGGTAIWRNRRSAMTATLARKLVAAGMIVLGKTHTVEFAYGAWGTNEHLGTPWNPWDADTHRTPGGSSSGSAVAVAARMVPCAIGTDTGGSVRAPAAWCGITGLKTTIGRISTHGVLPLSGTLDTPGPITRSVEDAALLLEVLQGADPSDPHTLVLRDADPMPTLRRGVKGLRLGRIPEAQRAGVDAEMLAAYYRSVDLLAGLGAEIVEIALPRSFQEFGATVGRIISAESYALLAELVDDESLALDEAVRPRIRAGAGITSREYLAILAERADLKRAYAQATGDLDALLAPTMMTPPVPIADVDQGQTPALFTRWVNLLDLCALAVPNGLTGGGLPLSLQIVCPGGGEAMALRIGHAHEQATDWHTRVPPVAT